MKKITLLVVLMGVLFTTTYANDENKSSQRDQRTYFKEQVKPKVDAQRVKLDPAISDSDKQEISRLREELIHQKRMEDALISEARTTQTNGENIGEDIWQEIMVEQIMIDNLLDEAKIIADKYEPQLQKLVASINVDLPPLPRETNQGHHQRRAENLLKSMDSVRFLLWDVN